MKALVVALVLTLATTTAAAGETKLGTGVSLKKATPIGALIDKPADFLGKPIRVDGVATAVCEEMGCWMAVASGDDPKGKTVRLKVEDGVIKFPVTAKGRNVSAEGIFEKIAATDEHAKEAAGEHGKHDAGASKKYQIKATGAVIR
ncbi:MAG: DUF4920 domain-containing protein [Acidobacteria bacterium]|nr:DUF4920 domain-containing protein [Acidobacteriota bacterium]